MVHITKWQDGMMHVVPWRKVFFSASAWKAFVIYPIVHAVAADAMSDRYSVEPVFYVCIEYGIRGKRIPKVIFVLSYRRLVCLLSSVWKETSFHNVVRHLGFVRLLSMLE